MKGTGGGYYYGRNANWGPAHYGGGGLGLILVIIIVLVLLGRI